MLVLSRKSKESLVIGGNVTVTVLEIRGGRVRLGIDAPQNVAVHRSELAQRHAGAGQGSAPEPVVLNYSLETSHDGHFC